jgi:hypothetical protein
MPQETAPSTETPVIAAGHTFATITDKISMIVLTNPVTRRWWVGFAATFLAPGCSRSCTWAGRSSSTG